MVVEPTPLAAMRGSVTFIQGIGNARPGMVLAFLDAVMLCIRLSGLFGIARGWGFFGFVLGYGLAPSPSVIYVLADKWEKRKNAGGEDMRAKKLLEDLGLYDGKVL